MYIRKLVYVTLAVREGFMEKVTFHTTFIIFVMYNVTICHVGKQVTSR